MKYFKSTQPLVKLTLAFLFGVVAASCSKEVSEKKLTKGNTPVNQSKPAADSSVKIPEKKPDETVAIVDTAKTVSQGVANLVANNAAVKEAIEKIKVISATQPLADAKLAIAEELKKMVKLLNEQNVISTSQDKFLADFDMQLKTSFENRMPENLTKEELSKLFNFAFTKTLQQALADKMAMQMPVITPKEPDKNTPVPVSTVVATPTDMPSPTPVPAVVVVQKNPRILARDTAAKVEVWELSKTTGLILSRSGITAANAADAEILNSTAWRLFGSGDFDGDGNEDLYMKFYNGVQMKIVALIMNGTAVQKTQIIYDNLAWEANTAWEIVSLGDANHDGMPDIYWHNGTSGSLVIWYMTHSGLGAGVEIKGLDGNPLIVPSSSGWVPFAVADRDGDERDDLFWLHSPSGKIIFWSLESSTITAKSLPEISDPLIIGNSNYKVVGAVDLLGDGKFAFMAQNRMATAPLAERGQLRFYLPGVVQTLLGAVENNLNWLPITGTKIKTK